MSGKNKLTGSSIACNILFGVNEALKLLLLSQSVIVSFLVFLNALLTFELLQLATVFVLAGDDILQNCLFVEEEAIFTVVFLRDYSKRGMKKEGDIRNDRIVTRLQG